MPSQGAGWASTPPSQVIRTVALLNTVVVLVAIFLLWQVRTFIGWFVIALFLAAVLPGAFLALPITLFAAVMLDIFPETRWLANLIGVADMDTSDEDDAAPDASTRDAGAEPEADMIAEQGMPWPLVPSSRIPRGPGRVAGVCQIPSINRVRPAWLQWGEKSFSALLPTIWLTRTSRTLPMEVHLDVALCQQDAEPWLRLCVVAREPSSDER
jgi:hypothetical protein